MSHLVSHHHPPSLNVAIIVTQSPLVLPIEPLLLMTPCTVKTSRTPLYLPFLLLPYILGSAINSDHLGSRAWVSDVVMLGDIATMWRDWPRDKHSNAERSSLNYVNHSHSVFSQAGNLTPPTFNQQIRNLTSRLHRSHTFLRVGQGSLRMISVKSGGCLVNYVVFNRPLPTYMEWNMSIIH